MLKQFTYNTLPFLACTVNRQIVLLYGSSHSHSDFAPTVVLKKSASQYKRLCTKGLPVYVVLFYTRKPWSNRALQKKATP